ncbi:hypothetical protein HOY80DRAFT_1007750 [Tuber brumale]|nr:hypothetical protein HOY80DRAFT_1007750 [Tuber brumale]
MCNAHDRGATEPFKILHMRFPFPPSVCDSPPLHVVNIHVFAHRNVVVVSKVLSPVHIYHFVFERCPPGRGATPDRPSRNGRHGLYRLAGRGARVLILPAIRVFVRRFVRCDRLCLSEGSLELGFVQAAPVEAGGW